MEAVEHTSEYHEKYEREHGETCPDCREWENHELRYPFGETPEEVIRERFAEFRVRGLDDLPENYSAAALLTVLDALKVASQSQGNYRPLDEDPEFDPNEDAYILRLSILAALGIDES